MKSVYEVDVPEEMVSRYLPATDFCDAFELVLNQPDMSLEEAARLVFGQSPKWIISLLALRNFLVKPFGLHGEVPMDINGNNVIGFFPIISQNKEEIILGFDDKHLNFRIAVLKDEMKRSLTVATLVERNNLLGKLYLFIVKPFHRIIVPTMLKQVNLNDGSA